MSSKASLLDVAQLAGVSKTTASVVLSRGKQYDRISQECVERVESCARQLGYVPNHAMRMVRLGRAETIGMPLEVSWAHRIQETGKRLNTAYFDELWSGVRAACQLVGYLPMQILAREDRPALDRGVRSIRSGRLDGMVVPASLDQFDAEAVERDAKGHPIVLMDSPFPDSTLPMVRFDVDRGVRLMAEHLYELGHRDVVWLGQDRPLTRHMDRERAFITTAWDLGIRGASCRYKDPGSDVLAVQIERPMQELLAYMKTNWEARPFTAVACYSDINAIGALRALRAYGLRVPEDVSVIGFDQIESVFTVPDLTSINHKLFDIGYRATEMLLEMIGNGPEARQKLTGRIEIVEPELALGESTGPARIPK